MERNHHSDPSVNKKVIGITAPDLLIDHGGAINHTINVIIELSEKFDFVFIPNPSKIKKYRSIRDNIMGRINYLRSIGVIIPSILDKTIFSDIKKNSFLKEVLKLHVDGIFNFDYYFPIENGDFTKLVSEKKGINSGICLQGLGDYSLSPITYFTNTIRLLLASRNIRVVAFRFYQYLSRTTLVARINHSKNTKVILAINSNLSENVKLRKNFYSLYPSNGIENPLASIPNINKIYTYNSRQNQIIFVARHSYAKGTFDLKTILNLVFQKSTAKLVLIGKFDHKSEEMLFKKIMSEYLANDRIVYRGFVNDKELYNEIGKSKVMIYPSHSDSFSLSVAQSISLKTPVVAYNIAGLEIYKELKTVHLVNEFDYKAMASEILKLLAVEDPTSLFGDAESEFIEKHTWHNVANQYKEFLYNL